MNFMKKFRRRSSLIGSSPPTETKNTPKLEDEFDNLSISESKTNSPRNNPSVEYFEDPLGVIQSQRDFQASSYPPSTRTLPSYSGSRNTQTPRYSTFLTNTPSGSHTSSICCPFCSTPLYSNDESTINQHIKDCPEREKNSTRQESTPIRNPSDSTITPRTPPQDIRNHRISTSQGLYRSRNRSPSTRRDHLMVRSNTAPVYPSNPFLITCPYKYCFKQVEVWEFYKHATKYHRNGPQNFPCPICALQSSESYRVHSQTNLMAHLDSYHRTDDQDTPPPGLGTRYLVDTVSKAQIGIECTICFEEFAEGDTIARLECLCIFHKHCLEAWFIKKSVCPLHKD